MDEEATSIGVYLAVLHGLERLIIADCGLGRPFSEPTLVDAIIKLSIDRFECSAQHSVVFSVIGSSLLSQLWFVLTDQCV